MTFERNDFSRVSAKEITTEIPINNSLSLLFPLRSEVFLSDLFSRRNKIIDEKQITWTKFRITIDVVFSRCFAAPFACVRNFSILQCEGKTHPSTRVTMEQREKRRERKCFVWRHKSQKLEKQKSWAKTLTLAGRFCCSATSFFFPRDQQIDRSSGRTETRLSSSFSVVRFDTASANTTMMMFNELSPYLLRLFLPSFLMQLFVNAPSSLASDGWTNFTGSDRIWFRNSLEFMSYLIESQSKPLNSDPWSRRAAFCSGRYDWVDFSSIEWSASARWTGESMI